MRGYDQLVIMRRNRMVPASVHISDGWQLGHDDWQHHMNPWTEQLHAVIQVQDNEIPEALDLRALIGLAVTVSGWKSEDATRRLFEAVRRHKPKFVGAVYSKQIGLRFEPTWSDFYGADID